MLWDAGQQRLGRERKERLSESFVAFYDAALNVLVSTGQFKAKGSWHLPSYMRTDQPPERRSPAIRDATLAKLGVMFPGMVRRADS